VLSVLFKPQFLFSFLIFSGQMEGFPPSSIEEDVNMISDELDLQSLLSELELHSYVILKHILSEDDCLQFSYSSVYPIYILFHGSRPAPEVPVNQGSILCNDQGGQNNVINDSIQQTTQFPTSFPETMVSTHAYSNLLQCPLN
jgi:hypothetical protein